MNRLFSAYADGTSGYRVRVKRHSNSGVTETDETGKEIGETEWGEPEVFWIFKNANNDESMWNLFVRILKQVSCDQRLARIFGDGQSIATTAYEPKSVSGNTLSGTRFVRDRLGDPVEDPRRGNAHFFSNSEGSRRSSDSGFAGNIFVPTGFNSVVGKADVYDGKGPTGKDAVDSNIQVTYKRGSLKSFGHAGDLRISFVHAGPIFSTDLKPTPIKSNITNSAGSVLIGKLGADGSEYDGGGNGGFQRAIVEEGKILRFVPSASVRYVHSHVIFYSGGKRIDPRTVFCRNLGF